MLIALDYDGTYTEDPALWNYFIMKAQGLGHSVIVCTMRHPHEAIDVQGLKVYYTSRKAKKLWLEERNIKPTVFIDDSPAWLFQDAK